MDPTRDKGAPPPSQQAFATEHLLDDLEGRSVRGGAVTLTAQFCRFGLTLGSTAVLARLLTPADFGLVAMVHAIIGFLSMFGEAGLSAATVQRQQIDHRQVSTLFWLNVALGVCLMLLLAASAPAVAWFFREPRLLGVTLVLAAVFPVTALAIQHRALLTRQLRFAPLAAVSVLSQAVGYGIAIVAAWRGAGYWALVLAALVTPATQTLGMWVASGWLPGRPVRGSGVRSMVRFGGELTGFDLLNYGAANLDRLLLGRFWGATSLGLYSRAYQLLMMPIRQINSPVAAVAVPVLSRLQGDSDRYRLAYLSMMEKVAMVTMPLAALMILTADWLIALVLGPQWNEAAELFVYLGFAALLLPIANTSGWLFVSQGRSGHMLRWGFLDAGIKITSIAVGLPWGPRGVAVAVMLRTLLAFPLLWWVVCRVGPVRAREVYRRLAPLAAATLGSLAAGQALRSAWPSVTGLVGIAAVAAASTLGFLAVLAVLPAGRRALRDVLRLGRSLLQSRASVPEQESN